MDYPKEPGHAFGSATSEAAAEAIAPMSGPLRERVYRVIVGAGYNGMTDEECAVRLGMRINSETARRRELELAGQVFDSGRLRKNSSGVDRVVWVGARDYVNEGYKPRPKGSAGRERHLRRIIYRLACHAQGGHSEAGHEVSELLNIPFPLTMANLEKAATRDGFEPMELWPWLYKMRADREQARKEPRDPDGEAT